MSSLHPSMGDVEASRALRVRSQSGLQSEIQARLSYTVRLVFLSPRKMADLYKMGELYINCLTKGDFWTDSELLPTGQYGFLCLQDSLLEDSVLASKALDVLHTRGRLLRRSFQPTQFSGDFPMNPVNYSYRSVGTQRNTSRKPHLITGNPHICHSACALGWSLWLSPHPKWSSSSSSWAKHANGLSPPDPTRAGRQSS